MHYKDLLKKHEKFYGWEARAGYYDVYMKEKNWEEWDNPSQLSDKEVKKLFEFIVKWDSHFGQERNQVVQFKQAYQKVFPLFKQLKREKIYKISYEKKIEYPDGNLLRLQEAVSIIFNTIANCFHRYESTDTSKIIHTINPEFFVMWDRGIRSSFLGNEEGKGEDYAHRFIPRMYEEIREGIESFTRENHCSEEEAVKRISLLADNKSLAKLLDEYNYVTKHFKLKELLEEMEDKRAEGDEEQASKEHNEANKMRDYLHKAQRMKKLLFKEVDGMFPSVRKIIEEMTKRGSAEEIMAFVENSVRNRPEIDPIIRKRSKSGKAFADVLLELRKIFEDP